MKKITVPAGDKISGWGKAEITGYTLPKEILDAISAGELKEAEVHDIINRAAHPGIIELKPVYSENLWTTAGWNEILKIFTGNSTTLFSATNARLGVGNIATAAAIGQTALLGTSQEFATIMSGYPTVPTAGTIQYKSAYTTTMANFEWLEWGLKNAASGVLFNRSVSFSSAPGTKTSSQYKYLIFTMGTA